jgi:hypothetical protein
MICFVFDMYCLFLIWFVLSVICTACFLYDLFCLWYVLLEHRQKKSHNKQAVHITDKINHIRNMEYISKTNKSYKKQAVHITDKTNHIRNKQWFVCLWYVLHVSYMIYFVCDMYCLFIMWFFLSMLCTACFLYDLFI